MKIHKGIILFVLAVVYALVGCLLFTLAQTLEGTPTLWSSLLVGWEGGLKAQSNYVYLVVYLVCALMTLHLIYMTALLLLQENSASGSDGAGADRGDYARERRREDCRGGRSTGYSGLLGEESFVDVFKKSAGDKRRVKDKPVQRDADEQAQSSSTELCINYWERGQEGKRVRMSFAQLRRRGALRLGQPGRSDIGFSDASLAPRHAEVRLLEDHRLVFKHLLSGVQDSVRVNGRLLPPGGEVVLDGMTDIYMGLTHLVIRIR